MESRHFAAGRHVLLALLVTSVCINYIDRGNLSVASEQIGRELALRPGAKGLLFSAFFWSYAFCLPFVGWLIDRYRVLRVYTIGYLLWSVATVLTGFASSVSSLFLLRLLLGAGESVAYPAYSKFISASFREDERGKANAFIDAGSKAGPAVGVMAGALLLEVMGWRGMFFAVGIVSLLWLIPWFLSIRKLRWTAAVRSENEGCPPTFFQILGLRAAWATMIGLFCGNYVWYFLLTWLPQYLVSERHYTTRMLAWYGWLPFLVVAVSSLLGGWLSDLWIRRGANPSLVRKAFVGGGMLLSTLLLPGFLVRDKATSLAIVCVACVSFGMFSSNIWAITQTLAGVRASGKWTGVQNSFGNLAGVVAPYVTGQIVERTGSYFFAFVWVAVIVVVGACSYTVFLGPVREVDWPGSQRFRAEAAIIE